jgi:hypothetical protein
MVFLPAAARTGHLQRGHLQRNIINVVPGCAHMKLKWTSIKSVKYRFITGILHVLIILCLVADKHLHRYCHLHSKGVNIPVCVCWCLYWSGPLSIASVSLLVSGVIVKKCKNRCNVTIFLHFDMDMSYARRVRTASHSSHISYSVSRKVLHQRTASHSSHTSHSVSHKWRNAAAAMRAHNVLCNSYNSITVEMNRCSFRRVRFALWYIVTRSKIV